MPKSDAEFVNWHDRLKAGATAIGATLGIAADDLTEIGDDNTDIHAKVSAAATANVTAKQANKAKDDARREIEGHVRRFAKRVKGHRSYTEAHGIQLGIEGAVDTTDMNEAQPVLVGTALGKGAVEIGFNKMLADGVNLYTWDETLKRWVFLARDTNSPYVDNRALADASKPEMRRYMAKFVIGDQEVGYESDAITVATVP
jgi:hypothetical protein